MSGVCGSPSPLEILRPEEIELVELVARGLVNKQIAHVQGIGYENVKQRLHCVCRRVGISGAGSRVSLAVWYRQFSNIPPVGPPGIKLFPRELELISLIAAGFTNEQAARTMGISRKTVARYMYCICKKFGIEGPGSRVQLALWYVGSFFRPAPFQ